MPKIVFSYSRTFQNKCLSIFGENICTLHDKRQTTHDTRYTTQDQKGNWVKQFGDFSEIFHVFNCWFQARKRGLKQEKLKRKAPKVIRVKSFFAATNLRELLKVQLIIYYLKAFSNPIAFKPMKYLDGKQLVEWIIINGIELITAGGVWRWKSRVCSF